MEGRVDSKRTRPFYFVLKEAFMIEYIIEQPTSDTPEPLQNIFDLVESTLKEQLESDGIRPYNHSRDNNVLILFKIRSENEHIYLSLFDGVMRGVCYITKHDILESSGFAAKYYISKLLYDYKIETTQFAFNTDRYEFYRGRYVANVNNLMDKAHEKT